VVPPDDAATPLDRTAAVLAEVAAARAEAGCDPLTASPGLAAAAGDAAVAGTAGRHTLVARGGSAAEVVAGWLAGADGRAVLLDCDLTRLGAAEVAGGDVPEWAAALS
jgi:uncharacterized protein YkwD